MFSWPKSDKRKTKSSPEPAPGSGSPYDSDLMRSLRGYDQKTVLDEVPRYPPFVEGIPVYTPVELLASQKELVRKILILSDLEPEDKVKYLEPALLSYAAFVNLLPASEDHHHSGVGGLLRHGLEVAHKSLEICKTAYRFESRGTPRENQRKEQAWRLAVTIAGLYHDVGKAVTDMYVMSHDGTYRWPRFKLFIHEWAQENEIDHFYVSWLPNRTGVHELVTTMAASPHIRDVMEFIGEYRDVETVFINTLNYYADNQTLAQIVMDADRYSVQEDMKIASIRKPKVTHPTTYILDAFYQLIARGDWMPNTKGEPLWVFEDGVYLAWNRACKDALDWLKKQNNDRGIPHSPNVLADMFVEVGLARAHNVEDKTYALWPMTCDLLVDDQGNNLSLNMVKFDHGVFFKYMNPEAINGWVFSIQEAKQQRSGELPLNSAETNEASPLSDKTPPLSAKKNGPIQPANETVLDTIPYETGQPEGVDDNLSTGTGQTDWLSQVYSIPGGEVILHALKNKSVYRAWETLAKGGRRLYVGYPQCPELVNPELDPDDLIKDLQLSGSLFEPNSMCSTSEHNRKICLCIVGDLAESLFETQKSKDKNLPINAGSKISKNEQDSKKTSVLNDGGTQSLTNASVSNVETIPVKLDKRDPLPEIDSSLIDHALDKIKRMNIAINDEFDWAKLVDELQYELHLSPKETSDMMCALQAMGVIARTRKDKGTIQCLQA